MKNFPAPVWSTRMFKYQENSIYLQCSECSPLQNIQHETKRGC